MVDISITAMIGICNDWYVHWLVSAMIYSWPPTRTSWTDFYSIASPLLLLLWSEIIVLKTNSRSQNITPTEKHSNDEHFELVARPGMLMDQTYCSTRNVVTMVWAYLAWAYHRSLSLNGLSLTTQLEPNWLGSSLAGLSLIGSILKSKIAFCSWTLQWI